MRSLQSHHVGYVLVGGRFFLMGLLPARQIPNLKTPATADQSDFAFQAGALAEILRQNEASLPIGRAVLRAGMQLAKKNTAISRRNSLVVFNRGAHARKLLRRHDQQKLIMRFRKNDEFFGAMAAPAGRDGDAIFLVNGVAEFAGEEELR